MQPGAAQLARRTPFHVFTHAQTRLSAPKLRREGRVRRSNTSAMDDDAMRRQDVVCAFILPQGHDEADDGRGEFKLLCAQRHDDADYFPSLYEFVGGKVDDGETHHAALVREVEEELGVRVALVQSEPAFTFSHPPKRDVKRGDIVVFHLFFYWARLVANPDGSAPAPRPLASQKVLWLTPQEMTKVSFCSGDEDIIVALGDGSLRPLVEAR